MLNTFSMDAFKIAEDKFGKERGEQLRSEIEELAAEIEKLRSVPVDMEDEP